MTPRIRDDGERSPIAKRGRPNASKKGNARRLLNRCAWLDDPWIFWTGKAPEAVGPNDGIRARLSNRFRSEPAGIYSLAQSRGHRWALLRLDLSLVANAAAAHTASRRFPKALPPLVGDPDAWRATVKARLAVATRLLEDVSDGAMPSPLVERHCFWLGEEDSRPSARLDQAAIERMLADPALPADMREFASCLLGRTGANDSHSQVSNRHLRLGARLPEWPPDLHFFLLESIDEPSLRLALSDDPAPRSAAEALLELRFSVPADRRARALTELPALESAIERLGREGVRRRGLVKDLLEGLLFDGIGDAPEPHRDDPLDQNSRWASRCRIATLDLLEGGGPESCFGLIPRPSRISAYWNTLPSAIFHLTGFRDMSALNALFSDTEYPTDERLLGFVERAIEAIPEINDTPTARLDEIRSLCLRLVSEAGGGGLHDLARWIDGCRVLVAPGARGDGIAEFVAAMLRLCIREIEGNPAAASRLCHRLPSFGIRLLRYYFSHCDSPIGWVALCNEFSGQHYWDDDPIVDAWRLLITDSFTEDELAAVSHHELFSAASVTLSGLERTGMRTLLAWLMRTDSTVRPLRLGAHGLSELMPWSSPRTLLTYCRWLSGGESEAEHSDRCKALIWLTSGCAREDREIHREFLGYMDNKESLLDRLLELTRSIQQRCKEGGGLEISFEACLPAWCGLPLLAFFLDRRGGRPDPRGLDLAIADINRRIAIPKGEVAQARRVLPGHIDHWLWADSFATGDRDLFLNALLVKSNRPAISWERTRQSWRRVGEESPLRDFLRDAFRRERWRERVLDLLERLGHLADGIDGDSIAEWLACWVDPEDGDPARLARIGERLGDRELYLARLSRGGGRSALRRVREQAGLDLLEWICDRSHNRFWADLLGDAPVAVDLRTPRWENARRLCHSIVENRRLFRRFLRSAASGDDSYRLEHPENVRWMRLAAAAGVDVELWIAPLRRTYRVGGRTLTIRSIDDPLEVLEMGDRFGTCLSIGNINDYSLVANALELNKRVYFLEDEKGRVRGRKLVMLSSSGSLYGYYSYGVLDDHGRQSEVVRALFDVLCAELCAILPADPVAEDWDGPLDDEGEVPLSHPGRLFARWYDDGTEDFPWWLREARWREIVLTGSIDSELWAVWESRGGIADPENRRLLLWLGDALIDRLEAIPADGRQNRWWPWIHRHALGGELRSLAKRRVALLPEILRTKAIN